MILSKFKGLVDHTNFVFPGDNMVVPPLADSSFTKDGILYKVNRYFGGQGSYICHIVIQRSQDNGEPWETMYDWTLDMHTITLDGATVDDVHGGVSILKSGKRVNWEVFGWRDIYTYRLGDFIVCAFNRCALKQKDGTSGDYESDYDVYNKYYIIVFKISNNGIRKVFEYESTENNRALSIPNYDEAVTLYGPTVNNEYRLVFKGDQHRLVNGEQSTETTPITIGYGLKFSTADYNHRPLTQVEVAELITQCKAYVQSKKQS